MPIPTWVNDPTLSDEDRQKQLLNFRLRLAALHHNKHASVTKLSVAAGYSEDYLATAITRGKLRLKAELAIRQIVGNEAFPEADSL